MNEDAADRSPARKTSFILMRAAVVLMVLLVVIGVTIVLTKRFATNQVSALQRDLVTAQKSADFTLYYPTSLPTGFTTDPASLVTSNNVVNYTLKYPSGTVIVTQQLRPQNIEEVKKTQEFTTSSGPAYLADLNGHTTGFLRSDKTLVILSSADKPDSEALKQILTNLSPAR